MPVSRQGNGPLAHIVMSHGDGLAAQLIPAPGIVPVRVIHLGALQSVIATIGVQVVALTGAVIDVQRKRQCGLVVRDALGYAVIQPQLPAGGRFCAVNACH